MVVTYPLAYVCVIVRPSILRQVSRVTSFEMVFQGQYQMTLMWLYCAVALFRRLNYTSAIWYDICKWYGMGTRGLVNALIESRWMNVWDVLMRWVTSGPVLDGMTKWVLMVDDTLRLGMTSRHMSHVNWELGWQNEIQCCIERPRPRVEARLSPNDLTYFRGKSIVSQMTCVEE